MAVWVRSGGCGVRPPPWPPAVAKRARKKGWVGAVCCSLLSKADAQQQLSQNDGIGCYLCSGSGWLICDFCQGQKTNVKSESSRFYRRCPYCKAVGLVLCPKCKVFKCVTFPDLSDGQL
ncbi:uncharacterized protein LOC110026108 [Phalaenopsis equestris]|uniref:uncharacterized protein LOC110026108 n=1 Tax=Phalaenopsis equestris TaxID=78828 RepID=UPI0009E2AD40|nr:uncharacterized protein LOC110026108 [Phalaenopsis equestris]